MLVHPLTATCSACLSFLGQIGKISKEENMRKTDLNYEKAAESSLLSCQIVWKKASQVSTSRHTFQYCDHLNVPLILQLLSILTLAHLDPRSTFCQKSDKKVIAIFGSYTHCYIFVFSPINLMRCWKLLTASVPGLWYHQVKLKNIIIP